MGFGDLWFRLHSYCTAFLEAWSAIGSHFDSSIESLISQEWPGLAWLPEILRIPGRYISGLVGLVFPNLAEILYMFYMWPYEFFMGCTLLDLCFLTPLICIAVKLISKIWDLLPLV